MAKSRHAAIDRVMVHTPTRQLRIFVPSVRATRHYWPTFLEPLGERLGASPITSYQRGEAGQWIHHGTRLLELAEPDRADVAVLPFSLDACGAEPELRAVAARLAVEAQNRGLPMLVFSRGDVEATFLPSNCLVLARDLHRERLTPTDVPTPTWIEDPGERIEISPRPWTARPLVNFVGQAYPLGVEFESRRQAGVKWAKMLVRAGLTATTLAKPLSAPPYYAHRLVGVIALQRARGIDSRVQLRASMTRLDLERPEDQDHYLEFLAMISGSDYTLAPRGDANHSYRLYESLACGRPAIVVDSKMAYPCAELPWRDVVVELKLRELPRLGQHVQARHGDVRERWAELQRRCRTSWLEHLSADGYFTRLVHTVTAARDACAVEASSLASALR